MDKHKINRIAFRVDVNETVATGHVMRCLTIADKIKKFCDQTGDIADITFISADDGIMSFARDNGYSYHVLGTAWDQMDSETELLKAFVKENYIDKIVVDSYQVTPAYFKALKEAGLKVFYIDDINKFHYEVDGLLNYSPSYVNCGYEEEYKEELAADKIRILLGTDYVPLRDQFLGKKGGKMAILEKVMNQMLSGNVDFDSVDEIDGLLESGASVEDIDKFLQSKKPNESSSVSDITNGVTRNVVNGLNIFVTSGGSDPLNISEKIINKISADEAISKTMGDGQFHLLAGRSYQASEEMRALINSGKVVMHQNVTNVAEIMKLCQMAVTPAGTTLYELCACGVPAVSYTFADNQDADANFFADKGLISYAGDFRKDEEGTLNNIIQSLGALCWFGEGMRKDIGAQQKALIDGKGAERIAFEIVNL